MDSLSNRSFHAEVLRASSILNLTRLLRQSTASRLPVRTVATAWKQLQRARDLEAVEENGLLSEAINILLTHTRGRGAEWEGRNVSMTLHTMARLGCGDRSLMLELAEQLVDGAVHTLNAQGVANIAWAYAKMGVIHPGLMQTLAERCVTIGRRDPMQRGA